MNLSLGLRALALLAFVVASTAVIVTSELIGGGTSRPLNPVLALGPG